MRYVGPLTDFEVKRIFTEPHGQPLLISLLNVAVNAAVVADHSGGRIDEGDHGVFAPSVCR